MTQEHPETDTIQFFFFPFFFFFTIFSLKSCFIFKTDIRNSFLEQESFQFSSLLFIVTLNEFSLLGKVEFTLSDDGEVKKILLFLHGGALQSI